MALIIEGSDNLGKTTAAEKMVKIANLKGRYPVRYGHMSRPPGQFDFLNDYKNWTTPYTVQDRFHIGGLIWHEDEIDTDSLRLIESHLFATGSIVVVFYTEDRDWYRQRVLASERDEMFDPRTVMKANHQFGKLAMSQTAKLSFGKHSLPHVVPVVDFAVNVTENFVSDDILEEIVEAWFKRLDLVYGYRVRTTSS